MVEYINRDDALRQVLFVETRENMFQRIKNLPAADVVERKPLPEDVEELVKDLYAFAKDCTDSDMCRDCQLCFMCEDGWPPNAIAHLIETWSATHKAMTERKTGTWISYIEDGYLECPFCGSATNCEGDESELHFCFSCGAKMEGVRNDV